MSRCHSAFDFPEGWHIIHTPNHWCNEETMISYIEMVIVPYMTEKRRLLGLDAKHTGLVILGQQTTGVELLQRNNLLYAIVLPNCTDHLQPLDVSVNHAAKQFLRNKFENCHADNITAQKNTDKKLNRLM